MEKQERASYMRELIKLYRKQGKSANKARQLAGAAMRETAQGIAWETRAKRANKTLENFMAKAIEQDGILILPTKKTRRTYKNNGCRISSNARATSNNLFLQVAQDNGRDKTVLKGQDSGNLVLTKTICADNVKHKYHLRKCAMVSAKRYLKRQAQKLGLFGKRTTPDKPAIVWQVCDFSIDYPATFYPTNSTRYNQGLPAGVAYNHLAFKALFDQKD